MSTTVWINPNNSADRRRIDVKLSPVPTLPNQPNVSSGANPFVPAGFIRQLGWDGFMDTNYYINNLPVPNISTAGAPYYTGVLSPAIGFDPAAGQPFHTAPNRFRIDGIND